MTVSLRRRVPVDSVTVAGLGLTWMSVVVAGAVRWGVDSHAYWAAWRGPMYDHAPSTVDAFLYSPAFAEAIWPLVQLPWPVFGTLWGAASIIAFVHLFRPLGWQWVVPLTLCCTPEIFSGNVFWLFALVAAYGLRMPGLWSIPLLTKVVPGVALIWFVVRREWGHFGVALATTAAVVATSYAVDPGLWRSWTEMLTANAASTKAAVGVAWVPPLALRLPLAAALVAWGGVTGRRWTIPAAMVLATPVAGVAALVVLAALPRLYDVREHSPSPGPLALPA